MAEPKKPVPTPLNYDSSQYPFSSAFFDPDIMNGLAIKDLLDNAIPFAASSSVDYFEVVNGGGGAYHVCIK